jgi:hypothetical protein
MEMISAQISYGAPFSTRGVNDCLRRIPVIAGCSGEGQLTTTKPDGAEVKSFDKNLARTISTAQDMVETHPEKTAHRVGPGQHLRADPRQPA